MPPVQDLQNRSHLLCCTACPSHVPGTELLFLTGQQPLERHEDSAAVDDQHLGPNERSESNIRLPRGVWTGSSKVQEREQSVPRPVKNAAARLIQAKWRLHSDRVKAANLIQLQWRRHSSSRPCSPQPQHERKMTLSKSLHMAAKRIQRLWRHRINSRESVSPGQSSRLEDIVAAFPAPDAAPSTPRLRASLAARGSPQAVSGLPSVAAAPVACTSNAQEEAQTPGQSPVGSPFSDALNKAATVIQSMWRVHSGRSTPQASRQFGHWEPHAAAGDPSPAAARTPLSDALSDAASRIQRLWQRRRHSPPTSPADDGGDAGAGPSVAVSQDLTDCTPSFWEDPAGATEWFFGRVQSSGEPLLKAWWADRKKRALQTLVHSSAPVLRRTLGDIGEVVKGSVTSDPDMWTWVRPVAHSAVSEVWNDIEMEIESSLKVRLLVHSFCDDKPPTSTVCFVRLWLWIRSFILFHYLPYNKSIFGKLKDPFYIMMTASTLLPVFGVRVFFFSVILLMLLFPGPPDEYQLINFILTFKGTQFFTTGVAMMFCGAMKYYICYVFDGDQMQDCINIHGPGATDWLSSEVFDYFGSILLVWIAFLALPRSKVHWSGHRQTEHHEVKVYCCCLRGVPTRGGRLRRLLSYDMVSFVLSFSLFMPIYISSSSSELANGFEEDEWDHRAFVHAKETVFWCRILYSLLSLPFVIFVIPLCGRVLTHSVYTGYNKAGACVEFSFDEPNPDERPDAAAPVRQSSRDRTSSDWGVNSGRG
mmetsp:Transcript_12984/g.35925  ORF Transcript_12984/g.35925 Transcript_12984/m.35925 type:complete len:759 (-) Transcript_12984:84-2360(-)